ncbi:hypothetical protein J4G37_20030 [Microvirga sp. 3-52]|nr:hypothetical protein [Microvirga sp. 3-52]
MAWDDGGARRIGITGTSPVMTLEGGVRGRRSFSVIPPPAVMAGLDPAIPM